MWTHAAVRFSSTILRELLEMTRRLTGFLLATRRASTLLQFWAQRTGVFVYCDICQRILCLSACMLTTLRCCRYGYSFGWSGDEASLGTQKSLWGTTWTGTTWWDRPIHQGGPNSSRTLATYQFFPSPLRFTKSAWAQVNWHYDIGMIDLVAHCQKLAATDEACLNKCCS